MFRFGEPTYLYLLLLLPFLAAFYLYSNYKRRKNIRRFGDPVLLAQIMVMPSGVGASCEMSKWIPTVPSPASKYGATLVHAVFSMRAIIAGVANTSSVPLPIVFAELDSSAVTFQVPLIPTSKLISVPPFSVLPDNHALLTPLPRHPESVLPLR